MDITLFLDKAGITRSVERPISNSYTMGCPPVRGDNPRALASGLSYVQVGKHGITILYHQHQCRPCTHHEIFRAKVGKGGIIIKAQAAHRRSAPAAIEWRFAAEPIVAAFICILDCHLILICMLWTILMNVLCNVFFNCC